MAENSVRPAGTTYQAPTIQVMGLLTDLTASGTATGLPTGPKTPSTTSDYYIPTGSGGRLPDNVQNMS